MKDDRRPQKPAFAANTGPPDDRSDLLIAAWLKRQMPLRDFLLGSVFCTTSRWLIFGDTGVGKTLLATDIAGAMASGSPLLHWGGQRPARIMYLDGEMPAETFKERMELIAERYGSDIPFYGFNRDMLGDRAPPPLNTPAGQKWLWREIDAVLPDAIFFDSVMSLLIGSMSEEESWAPVKPLVRQITTRRIGQMWLHHTGHDANKSFGTKTREWEMDTVVALTQVGDDANAMAMEFRKARLRTPQNWQQFQSIAIRRGDDGFIIEGPFSKTSKASEEVEQVRREIVAAYDRLADAKAKSPGFDGKSVLKVGVGELRDEVKSRGVLEKDEKGVLTTTGRSHFRRAKLALLASQRWMEKDDLIWRVAA
jgi:hypothetical protein